MPGHRESKRSRRRGTAPGARSSHSPGSLNWSTVAVLAGVLGVTLAAYVGSLDHGFVDWDDPDYVQENAWVLRHDYDTLGTLVVSNNYHPLTMWSLAANASEPLSPRPFLTTNVLLHAVNAGLVFLLVWLLSGGLAAAGLAGLLFGVHPMHVESVAWISERKDVLYTFFFLLAAIAYERYLTRRRWPWLVLTFGLFTLSCLAKAMAVSFPLVMILIDGWKRRSPFTARAALEKAPFAAVALLVGLIALDVQGGGTFHGLFTRADTHLKGMADSLDLTAAQRWLLPLYGNLMYLVRFFVPVGQSPFYPYPSPTAPLGPAELFAPVVFLAIVGAAIVSRRRAPWLTLGLGWYLVTVALVLQWVPVGEAVMADRYTYLPYVGLVFALGVGLERLVAARPSLKPVVVAACALFTLFLFVRTLRQVEIWKDGDTLWTSVIRRYPKSEFAYVSRGNARGRTGRVEEAMSDLKQARALGSRRGSLYDGLGNGFGSLGQLDSALAMFDRGLYLEPNMPRTYYNRGIAYLRLGRSGDALADFATAGRLQPSLEPMIHFPRANALLQLARYGDAVAEYGRAIEAGVTDANVYSNRGLARMNLGDATGAAADFEEARRLSGGGVTH
jgi:protein O-mannosyl-transferase